MLVKKRYDAEKDFVPEIFLIQKFWFLKNNGFKERLDPKTLITVSKKW